MDVTLPFGTTQLLKYASKKKIEEWQKRKLEAVQEIILAEVKFGNLSLAQEDVFFSAILRLNKACLEGASRNKLRLMAQVLNGTLSEPSSDRGSYLEQILADMGEGEIFLIVRLYQHENNPDPQKKEFYDKKAKEEHFADCSYFRTKVDLVPSLYINEEAFDAALARLARTGLITPFNTPGATTYGPSPLMDELVQLCDIQAYNNPMNFEASAI